MRRPYRDKSYDFHPSASNKSISFSGPPHPFRPRSTDDLVKWLIFLFFRSECTHYLILFNLLCNTYNKNYLINSSLTLI